VPDCNLSTAAELLSSKLTRRDGHSSAGPWTSRSLMIEVHGRSD